MRTSARPPPVEVYLRRPDVDQLVARAQSLEARRRAGASPALLPPSVPPDAASLEVAIMLLGVVAKGADMRVSRRERLAQLTGRLPFDKGEARAWKRALVALRKAAAP